MASNIEPYLQWIAQNILDGLSRARLDVATQENLFGLQMEDGKIQLVEQKVE